MTPWLPPESCRAAQLMTELVRKAEQNTERLAAQLAAKGAGEPAALSACSPAHSPAVNHLIQAVRTSAEGLAGGARSSGTPWRSWHAESHATFEAQ